MKLTKRFFEEPDDNKGGEEQNRGVAATAPDGVENFGDSPKRGDVVEDKTPATVDADKLTSELASKFGDIIEAKFPKKVDEEKKVDTLTPEEAKKLLNVWEPDDAWVTKFDNLDTRKAALAELRDGVVKNTDTISQHRLRELQSAMDGKYGKVLEFMENYQNEQAEKRFHGKYPDLADPALGSVVEAVTEKIQKTGKKYDNETDLFEAIATGVEKVIQVHNKDFKLTAGSIPAKTKSNASNGGIPVTSPGAGGGTAASKGDDKPVKAWQNVFAK